MGTVTRTVTRTVRRAIEVIPGWVKVAIALLAGLVLALGAVSLLTAARGRRLARERERLLGEVGLLQGALLPAVPELAGVAASVAYRPAEGLAAGGDFYDVFRCADGSVGIMIGDLSGHGREAVSRTALVRHTVRAYIEAGLEPRLALQLAGRVLERSFSDEEFATILAARYHPDSATLVHAAAGHPPPVVLAPGAHAPVTVASAPAVALGQPTGQRQTRLELPGGAAVLFYTDGLLDAQREGEALGYDGLARLLSGCEAHASAASVVERIVTDADRLRDDMAACLLRVPPGKARRLAHTEELEASEEDLNGDRAERFLRGCGVPAEARTRAIDSGRRVVERSGTALLRVDLGEPDASVSVLDGNVVDIAERRGRPKAASQSG